MKIEVEGVELTVEQDAAYVVIRKVVGRDRKRKQDLLKERLLTRPGAEALCAALKQASNWQTARCTCDYGYGHSDHAEHCRSIYKADDPARVYDD